jgi:O-methyltransferase involved in polyketide biosynthesis
MLSSSRELVAARTEYFDLYFADAAAAGISQAVVLAAGLSGRSTVTSRNTVRHIRRTQRTGVTT